MVYPALLVEILIPLLILLNNQLHMRLSYLPMLLRSVQFSFSCCYCSCIPKYASAISMLLLDMLLLHAHVLLQLRIFLFKGLTLILLLILKFDTFSFFCTCNSSLLASPPPYDCVTVVSFSTVRFKPFLLLQFYYFLHF